MLVSLTEDSNISNNLSKNDVIILREDSPVETGIGIIEINATFPSLNLPCGLG